MSEQITLRQAKQWRAENQLLREQVAALRSEVDGLHARIGMMQGPPAFEEEESFNLFAAVIIWLFLGGLGFHRFYVGDTGRGAALMVSCVAMFLTAGLWAIVHIPWFLLDGACLFSDPRARR